MGAEDPRRDHPAASAPIAGRVHRSCHQFRSALNALRLHSAILADLVDSEVQDEDLRERLAQKIAALDAATKRLAGQVGDLDTSIDDPSAD